MKKMGQAKLAQMGQFYVAVYTLDPRPGAILHTLAAAPSWPLVATPGPATWGKASHDVRRASE